MWAVTIEEEGSPATLGWAQFPDPVAVSKLPSLPALPGDDSPPATDEELLSRFLLHRL